MFTRFGRVAAEGERGIRRLVPVLQSADRAIRLEAALRCTLVGDERGESAVGKYPGRAVVAMAEVIEGAETYQLARERGRDRFEGKVTEFAQAIAHAVMFTANHMDVEAIVALTESGSTPLWMSRIRSDIPIFAFTRHQRTQRRVALYRGVYPIPFDITHTDPAGLYRAISRELIDRGYVSPGDELILTLGEFSGVSGGTNTMKLLTVEG